MRRKPIMKYHLIQLLNLINFISEAKTTRCDLILNIYLYSFVRIQKQLRLQGNSGWVIGMHELMRTNQLWCIAKVFVLKRFWLKLLSSCSVGFYQGFHLLIKKLSSTRYVDCKSTYRYKAKHFPQLTHGIMKNPFFSGLKYD